MQFEGSSREVHIMPTMRTLITALRRAPWVLMLTAACGADKIASVAADSRSQTIAVATGQKLDITLGNVGPAQYEATPQLSSPALTFLGVEVVPPYTPAGPTQRFHFRAEARGVAIVRFRRMLGDSVISVVEDTVDVR